MSEVPDGRPPTDTPHDQARVAQRDLTVHHVRRGSTAEKQIDQVLVAMAELTDN